MLVPLHQVLVDQLELLQLDQHLGRLRALPLQPLLGLLVRARARVRVRGSGSGLGLGLGSGLGLGLGLGPNPSHGIVLADAPHQVGGIAGREVCAVLALHGYTKGITPTRHYPEAQPRDAELAASAHRDELILVELQGDHLG